VTPESGATTSVSCPLCHTVAPPMTSEALAAGGGWRCPQCHQNWSAARLATVAAYATYCAGRSESKSECPS
jgi:transposase